jgi:hypothetical protein
MKIFNEMTAEESYRLPFDVLRQTSIGVRKVIPSAKLSRHSLDRNRYYIDLTGFTSESAVNDLLTVVDALWMPEEARERFKVELDRFGHVVFLAAGQSRGKMAYRVYFGFSGTEERTINSAVSIDWVPATSQYFVKTYDEICAVPRQTELEVLRECLASDASEELTGDQLLIYDQISRITGKARGALHMTRIREPDAQRNSVSFNYYRVAYTANADIKEELDAIAAIFRLPLEIYKPWFRDTADLRIIDVAAGRAWNGEIFVTIYHGDLSEPPPYIRSGEDGELKPASAGPVLTGSARAAGARPASKGADGEAVTAPTAYGQEPLNSPATVSAAEDRVTASSLATGNSIGLVYAVGRIGIAYVSLARREQFARLIDGDPDDAAKVAKFLEANPEYSSSLIWTITTVDSIPLYCILPTGAFASDGFERLRKVLQDQLENDLEMASIPGEVIASVFLPNGQELAVISPALRGIRAWSVAELLDEVFGPVSADEAERQQQEAERRQLQEALDRIYFEMRNPGLLPRDRAINYAGTNIIQLRTVFHQVTKKRMHLAEIESRQSSFCRPGSDCWEIRLIFFDAERRLERARLVCQITVDVSDVVPVSVGKLRHWYAY